MLTTLENLDDLVQSGRAREAISGYSLALETTPFEAKTERAHLLAGRGAAHMTLAHWHEAERDYAAAEQLLPVDSSIAFKRALLLYRVNDGSELVCRRVLPICRDAFDRADTATRQSLREQVLDNPFYKPLAEALFGNQ